MFYVTVIITITKITYVSGAQRASTRRSNRRRSRSRSEGRRSRTRSQARKVGTRPRSLYASLRPVNRRRSRGNKAVSSAVDSSADTGGHSLLDLINSSTSMTSTLCPGKKRNQKYFCNIFYKTRTILMKFDTLFPE